MTSALTGVRVVDLSRVLAGPMCSQILADHGADVIKVEPPVGDDTRTLGPPFNENGDAAYFSALNRGKKCISIDLTKPRGRNIVERLLETADILIENFLPVVRRTPPNNVRRCSVFAQNVRRYDKALEAGRSPRARTATFRWGGVHEKGQ
jgi:hypothetical protein